MKRYHDILNSYSFLLGQYSRLVTKQDFKDYVGISSNTFKKQIKNISLGLKALTLSDIGLTQTTNLDVNYGFALLEAKESSIRLKVDCKHYRDNLNPLNIKFVQANESYKLPEINLVAFDKDDRCPFFQWEFEAVQYQSLVDHFVARGVIDSTDEPSWTVENDIKSVAAYYAEQGADIQDYLDISKLNDVLYWRKEYGDDWKDVYVVLNYLRDGRIVLSGLEGIIFHGSEILFNGSPSRLFLYEYFDLMFTVKWVYSVATTGSTNPFSNIKNQVDEQEKYKRAA